MKSALPIFALACLWGCSSSSTPSVGSAPTPKVEPAKPAVAKPAAPGWARVSAGGVSLELPATWKVVDLTAADLGAILEKTVPDEGMRAQMKMMAEQKVFKMYAFGPKVINGFQENMNINVMATPSSDLQQVLDLNLKELKQIAKSAKGRLAKDPDRTVIDSTMPAMTPDNKPVTYETHAHQIVHKGNLYTFTFSCMASERPAIEKLAGQAMRSVSFE